MKWSADSEPSSNLLPSDYKASLRSTGSWRKCKASWEWKRTTREKKNLGRQFFRCFFGPRDRSVMRCIRLDLLSELDKRGRVPSLKKEPALTHALQLHSLQFAFVMLYNAPLKLQTWQSLWVGRENVLRSREMEISRHFVCFHGRNNSLNHQWNNNKKNSSLWTVRL